MPSRARPTPRRVEVTEAFPSQVSDLLIQGDSAAADALRDIAEGNDRTISKSARKALYKLKVLGVEPSIRSPAPKSAVPPADQISAAYMSNYGGSGTRMLLFVREDRHGGNPTLITFLAHSETGLEDAVAGKMSRKEVAASLGAVDYEKGRVLAPVPVEYARYALRLAERMAVVTGKKLPSGAAELIRAIGAPAQDYPTSPVHELMDAEDVREDLNLSRSPDSVLEIPPFRAWLVDPREALPWLGKLDQAFESTIELTDSQKRQRAEKVIDDAADALIPPPVIRTYRHQLEESAYVLHLSGRTEEARQALYHALTLRDDIPAHSNPLLRTITFRTLGLLSALEEEEERRSESKQGRVITV